jgi:hypothetical protein
MEAQADSSSIDSKSKEQEKELKAKYTSLID